MASHWAVDIAAVAVVLAVTVPLVILTGRLRRRPRHRTPLTMPPHWEHADLWTTGVHPVPGDPRRNNVRRHRRR